MDQITTGAEMTVQTGVDVTPAAGGADQVTAPETPPTSQPDAGQDQNAPQADERIEKAFAARLKQAREQWEKEHSRYIEAARELEQYGYDLEALRQQARMRDVDALVQQGWDPQAAQELVRAREQAFRAQQEAQQARLEAEAARLAAKYGKDFDPDAVIAFAKKRASETGESLTLETAWALMRLDAARREGEQAALAALQAAQQKGTETGTKGAGQKSIADMTFAEIEAINQRVMRGEKVKF